MTQHDKFVATVIGPGFGTEWEYTVRCHSPDLSTSQSSLLDGDEIEKVGYGWSESNLTRVVGRYNAKKHRVPMTSENGRGLRKSHLRQLD